MLLNRPEMGRHHRNHQLPWLTDHPIRRRHLVLCRPGAPIPTESIASRISQLALIDVICAAIGIRRSGEAIPNAELFYLELSKRIGTRDK